MTNESIFERYYIKEEFIDRMKKKNEEGVDVIIPIFNTNELFEKNLFSIYREIPVNRLLIGDGGCTDDSLKILAKFPRIEIIDQTHNRTLGYCIVELISNVETEWFVYLHSDVYLPENWYDVMKKYNNQYDWYECDRSSTILVEYKEDLRKSKRAYSGSQMGRKEAFNKIISKIEDDYLYRNEDIVIHELLLTEGFKYGRVFDTFHYHQIMNKKGEKEPKLKKVLIERFHDKKWEIDTYLKQVKGIIKYIQPKPYLLRAVQAPLRILQQYNAINIKEFKSWVERTNKNWLPYVNLKDSFFLWMLKKTRILINKIFNKILN